MNTFEYKIIEELGDYPNEGVEAILNLEGVLGWELCAIDIDMNRYFFKKTVPDNK